MATEAQMDELIRSIDHISLECEGSKFESDDVQIITHSLFRIATSLDEISGYLKPKSKSKVVSQTVTDRAEIYTKIAALEQMITETNCAKKQHMLLKLQAIKDRV